MVGQALAPHCTVLGLEFAAIWLLQGQKKLPYGEHETEAASILEIPYISVFS